MDSSQLVQVDLPPLPTQFSEINDSMPMGSFMSPYEQPSGEINTDGLENRRDMHLKHNLDQFWNQQIQDIQNNTERLGMDSSQLAQVDLPPLPAQFSEINDSMPMGSFMSPYEQPSGEINADGLKNSRDMHLKHNLDQFWNQQIQDIQNNTVADSKIKSELPLARIKRVMKSDENVKLIKAETPALLSKACEFLISELTLRAWHEAENAHRQTLYSCDIASAIRKDDSLGFLAKTVPLDDSLKASYLVNPLPYLVPKSNPGFVFGGPEAQRPMVMNPASSTSFNYGSPAQGYVFNGLEAQQPMIMPQAPLQPTMMSSMPPQQMMSPMPPQQMMTPMPPQQMMMSLTPRQPMMMTQTPPQSIMTTPTYCTPSNYGAPAEGFIFNGLEAQHSRMTTPTSFTTSNYGAPAEGFVFNGQQSMMMRPTTSCTPLNYGPPIKVMRLNESNQGQVTQW